MDRGDELDIGSLRDLLEHPKSAHLAVDHHREVRMDVVTLAEPSAELRVACLQARDHLSSGMVAPEVFERGKVLAEAEGFLGLSRRSDDAVVYQASSPSLKMRRPWWYCRLASPDP